MTTSSSTAHTIEATLREASAAVGRNDLDGLLAMFHDLPETFLYDFQPPRRINLVELRASFAAMGEAADGPVNCEVTEIETHVVSEDFAWTAAIMRVTASMKDGSDLALTYRVTDLWREIAGRWAVIHEHASLPVDLRTGQADLQSAP